MFSGCKITTQFPGKCCKKKLTRFFNKEDSFASHPKIDLFKFKGKKERIAPSNRDNYCGVLRKQKAHII
ncbi:hypothetical protein DDZ16_11615 [Marinilabilia rubra]|uniref:Uncharacterized protein n=1 Tax=Marinilabilia rubra TaxID=2162893 RepID=A0A2U2B848_9BACT|nr:hypothetical protein DDZ16_11615 [Marinilabilia rubra]